MDKSAGQEAITSKTWGETAHDVLYNKYVDIAIAGAGVALFAYSRGKLAGPAEELFPKAASLLGATAEKDAAAFSASSFKSIPGRDLNLTSTQLSELAESKLSAIQYNVAVHPNVSADTLARLAQIGDTSIRETVAGNLKTSPEVLDGLANLTNARSPINLRIAGNPGTTAETLDKLVKANSPVLDMGLQRQIARHANTSPETLAAVVDGELKPTVEGASGFHFWDHDVVAAAAAHPNTTVESLKTIANSRESIPGATLTTVVNHPNATPEIVSDVASRQRYIDRDTWLAIAESPKSTTATLDGLVSGRAIQMDRQAVTDALLKNPNTGADTVAKLQN